MAEPKAPRRTQAERTQQRKKQVIREAIRYFGQYGYHGARLADIAKAAGVTEPGLLHHFSSKAQLLMEVLAERDRNDDERFGLISHSDTVDVLGSLQQLVEYNETVPGLVQLFTVLVAESIDEQHPGHEFFKRRYEGMRGENIKYLRQLQECGEVRADISAEDLEVMIFALMDGLQIQWLYAPEAVDMSYVFRQFIRLIRAS